MITRSMITRRTIKSLVFGLAAGLHSLFGVPSAGAWNLIDTAPLETPVPPFCGDGVCEPPETHLNCPEDCRESQDTPAIPPGTGSSQPPGTNAPLCELQLDNLRTWNVTPPKRIEGYRFPYSSPEVDTLSIAVTCYAVLRDCADYLAPGTPECHLYNSVCAAPSDGSSIEPLRCD